MLSDVEAVYENGVLRLLSALPLAEREHVKVTVVRAADEDWLDVQYMEACAVDADPSVTLEQVRSSLAKIRGSMDEAIQADRGDH
jgi:predicted DNA-binding antitoxin AbrB/MazE fold protein